MREQYLGSKLGIQAPMDKDKNQDQENRSKEINFRVLDISEIQNVAELEKKLLEALQIPADEAAILSWSAPWRQESLQHYAATGWSFGAWVGPQLVGYFLAQPIVFFRGYTQTLWIEHIAAMDENIKAELVDLARRYGRDKHLQSVLFADNRDLHSVLENAGAKKIGEHLYEVHTTKVRT
jgi:hypothetical protein